MHRERRPAQISLALLIASTITLAMLVLAIFLVGQTFRGMESAKVQAASVAARHLAISVDDRILAITAPPSTALAVLSHDPLSSASTLEERLSRLPVIANILRSSNIVSAVYTGYANGDFFLLRKVRSSGVLQFPDAPDGTRFLLQAIDTVAGEQRREWRFYDDTLNLLEQRAVPDYVYDPRSRPWFQSASETNRTVLSAPYIFFTTRETGLTLSRRAAGSTAAEGHGGTVFGIDVTVSDLSTQLAELKQTPGTHIAIVNGENQLLASTNDHSSPGPEISGALNHQGTRVSNSAVTRYEVEGEDWYGMSEPLNALSAQQLKIAVAIPADELLSEVWKTLVRQTLIAAVIALVLLVFGWFIGTRVGRPLERLTDQVSQLSRFRFDTQIKTDSNIREARELGDALDDMARTIHSFQSIATVLNRGQNLNELLHDILLQIAHIVGQERGAIYLFRGQHQDLSLAVNRDLDIPDTLNNITNDLDDNELIRLLRSQIGGHPVFAILRNRQKHLVGVLIVEMEHGDHTHLSDDLIVFVDEIAGSAAVAIETRELIESQQALLEGIIRLVANAIDAKSPYTGGHCERVPKLAQMMVEEAITSTAPAFAGFTMSEEEKYEFHLAAWLHDCGKITSPEYVVDKAVKLETIHNRIHEIRTRFEVLHRDAEIRYLKRLLQGDDEKTAQDERDDTQAGLQEDFTFVARANEGGEFMTDEDIARIRSIGERTWQRHFSDRQGLSTDETIALLGIPEAELPARETLLSDRPEHRRGWGDRIPPVQKGDPANRWGFDMKLPEHASNRGEVHNLTIAKGTLTEEERFKINEHIVQTICMLDALPLPSRLANVPRLAGTHHERMDGKGYPCGLTADDLGIPEKIMVVADVFEALTAVDRPYKKGKTLTESLTIMAKMVEEGHIDNEVFDLFVRSGTYRTYAEQHLRAEQIDAVDESLFMNNA
ncbi:HAMP domain-containing protein [Marinobacter salinexigens]|uniref:HAMP domain-containing protein n=1 Tax=Marinobacter salinexigens TaxID=2919747 RepID=A0A5B0V825_9GAMM|nr:HD domain-containing phosphohydrolase [Marinobacter salinexigens]KAA1170588.1 HAMP domain-containing protein [Marinobacter salinexigens]